MRPYLEGYHFTVVTDHQALKWLQTLDNPSGRLARWAVELQQYDYEVKYRRGVLNKIADALSRQPLPEKEIGTLSPEESCAWYRQKYREVEQNPQSYPEYCIRNQKLYRYIPDRNHLNEPNTEQEWKLCIPKSLRNQVMYENHDAPTAGHLGVAKTINRLAKLYYWPGMFRETARYVRNCPNCARYKPDQQKTAGKMYTLQPEGPWEIVSTDLIGPLPRSKHGNTMLLVFQDKFTKWVEIQPLRQATAPAVTRALKDRIIAKFGCPRTIITDNGPQYVSKMFTSTLKEFHIRHRTTPPYTPQANPTERVNRVIHTMLAQYVNRDHRNWDQYIPEFMLAINTSTHESTGYTPAYLNFGRELRLPTLRSQEECSRDYSHPKPILADIYNLVRRNLTSAAEKQKNYYNLRRRNWEPKVGEYVLKREHQLSSAPKNFAAKLAPRYSGPFRICNKKSPVVYELEEIPSGKSRVTAHIKDLKKSPNSAGRDYISEYPEEKVLSLVSTSITRTMADKSTYNRDPTVRKTTRPTKLRPPTKTTPTARAVTAIHKVIPHNRTQPFLRPGLSWASPMSPEPVRGDVIYPLDIPIIRNQTITEVIPSGILQTHHTGTSRLHQTEEDLWDDLVNIETETVPESTWTEEELLMDEEETAKPATNPINQNILYQGWKNVREPGEIGLQKTWDQVFGRRKRACETVNQRRFSLIKKPEGTIWVRQRDHQ